MQPIESDQPQSLIIVIPADEIVLLVQANKRERGSGKSAIPDGGTDFEQILLTAD